MYGSVCYRNRHRVIAVQTPIVLPERTLPDGILVYRDRMVICKEK